MSKRDWQLYGVCPECGYKEIVPLGDMWFLEMELKVCPKCGMSVKMFEQKIGRRVIMKKGNHFWSANVWGWEWKDE